MSEPIGYPVGLAELYHTINGREVFGAAGIRDPESPCSTFEPVKFPDWLGLEMRAQGNGDCVSDHHYLCLCCKRYCFLLELTE